MVLISFLSASSSRLDPYRPALVAFLAGCNARSSSGSGLTANRINQSNASGLYIAFNVSSLFSSTSA